MKMVKKILLGTVAVAAILSIASCKREVAGNSDMIQVNAASSKASIDYTNETDDISRGWKSLETKHTDAICKISSTISGTDTNGVMGYVFDLKDETDGTVSFSLAAIRFVPSASGAPALQGYVESYKNVDKSTLENGSGFKKADGTKATPKEATWSPELSNTPNSNFGKVLSSSSDMAEAYDSTTKTATIWVELVANIAPQEGNAANRTGTKGTYTVKFYTADPKRSVSGNNISYSADPVVEAFATATIAKDNVNTAFTTDLPETEQGFYATVYAGQTLKGEWKFDAIKKEAEEIEE